MRVEKSLSSTTTSHMIAIGQGVHQEKKKIKELITQEVNYCYVLVARKLNTNDVNESFDFTSVS